MFREEFHKYIQDNAQLIVKSMVKLLAERHTSEYKNMKTDWDWIMPDRYYLVTNNSSFYLINDFSDWDMQDMGEGRFYFVNLGGLKSVNDWSEERLLNISKFSLDTGFWRFSQDVWAMGYVIDLSNQVNMFMNWAENPF